MSNFDSDGPSENEWEDRGELAWTEFDWEQYLREQDEVIHRYIGFYEKLESRPERLDEVAHNMGWDEETWSSDAEVTSELPAEANATTESTNASSNDYDSEPYTLHKNPVFVATKAIYLTLTRGWERLADNPERVRQPVAMAVLSSLHRGQEQATLAIQALDFGDYAMATSLFKRALRELNGTLALVTRDANPSRTLAAYREHALPRLFDLREIWLRVMHECRQELERPAEDEDEE
jgi:hypothetical protein